MDLNDKEFQQFVNSIKKLKPIFYTQEIVGFDDGFGTPVSFCGYNSPGDYTQKMTEKISRFLFSLKHSRALNEIEDNYINLLVDELQKTLNSFKKLSFRNKEFSFQEESEIVHYVVHTDDSSKDETIQYSLDSIDDDFFEAVVAFSNAKYEMVTDFLNGLLVILNSNISSDNKLELKLSVADLALLFRLLDEEKLINYKHKAEIYRFVSGSFKTEKQSNISEDSFKNKFLSPDNTSIKNIDNLLTNLRLQLRKI